MPITGSIKNGLIGGALLSALTLTGCVSQSKYDALKTENQGLQQQVATQADTIKTQNTELEASKAQVDRLRGAIKYTVNSDMLFRSGGWDMSARGKQIISRMAAKLAPTQENKVMIAGYTDNAPIGSALERKGVASNQALSEKRAESVKQYLIAQGVKPDLLLTQGLGDASPVASNDTPAGRAKNRRVELSVASAASPGS